MLETEKVLKLNFMTLSQRLEKIEKQLEKVRGCSPLTHGWQTQKLAKAQRKWDELAKEKQRILIAIEEENEKGLEGN